MITYGLPNFIGSIHIKLQATHQVVGFHGYLMQNAYRRNLGKYQHNLSTHGCVLLSTPQTDTCDSHGGPLWSFEKVMHRQSYRLDKSATLAHVSAIYVLIQYIGAVLP